MWTSREDTHGHVLFVYADPKERQRLLADYFADGLDNNELCIYVSSDSPKKVLRDLKAAGLDAAKAYKQQRLRLFEMTPTYLPHGKFRTNFMLANVSNYIVEAKVSGFAGVRTAGDMDWLYDHTEFAAAAEDYENQVSDLHQASPEFTGMCLYPVCPDAGPLLDMAMRTHNDLIFDSSLRSNQSRVKAMLHPHA